MNVKYFKSGESRVLWDIDNKLLFKSKPGNEITKQKLSTASIQAVSSSMQVPWSLLPFKSISDLPEGASWKEINGTDGIDIYEIQWTKKSIQGADIFTKWRGFINSDTSLPKRIEWWNKTDADGEYELKKVLQISYPDVGQIKELIEKFR